MQGFNELYTKLTKDKFSIIITHVCLFFYSKIYMGWMMPRHTFPLSKPPFLIGSVPHSEAEFNIPWWGIHTQILVTELRTVKNELKIKPAESMTKVRAFPEARHGTAQLQPSPRRQKQESHASEASQARLQPKTRTEKNKSSPPGDRVLQNLLGSVSFSLFWKRFLYIMYIVMFCLRILPACQKRALDLITDGC